jgi:hypothetical protein
VEGQYKKILQKEFDYSFQLQYSLLPWVLKDVQKVEEYILRWLSDVYREIVEPMTIMTKQIMQDFQIVNEAELFCSDMEFKVSDDSISKRYIGDRSKNSEDVQKCCSERVQELIKNFRAKFDEIQKRVNTDNSALNERQAKKIVAHTVYFATYFHPE